MESKQVFPLPLVDILPFQEINESRPVVLVTSGIAWQVVKDSLNLTIQGVVNVKSSTEAAWDEDIIELKRSLPVIDPGGVVYAVGGGLAADAAKYYAMKLNLPLVVLPTALSVDAFITPTSAVRREGCVYYLPTKLPERLVLDFEVIAKAPIGIRSAGIIDVMSIATGCWDWKFAHEMGKNPVGMEFIPWVYDNAQAILNGVLDCAAAAGRADPAGLKMLYDCLAMEVQLANQMGHARHEEGSEHYFCYCVENYLSAGLPHGDLVGPAILTMARLQGQDTARYETALRACNVPLDRIPPEIITRTLHELPSFCRKHNLPFGFSHTLDAEKLARNVA